MRWVACVEYDGSAYHGWQSQPHAASVQDTLEYALAQVADAPIRVAASGRTDTGVHADAQIAHFDTEVIRSERGWTLGTNRYLPNDIAVRWIVPIDDDFHARHSATMRDYRYWITDRVAPTALWRHRVHHNHYPLAADVMHEAAQALIGEHDFSAFRAAACQSNTPWRNVHWVDVQRSEIGWIRIDIRANAFVHHMVRNIVGSLMEVGRSRRKPQWIAEILAERDRCKAGMTAPAHGLALRRVHYPDRYQLPEITDGPL